MDLLIAKLTVIWSVVGGRESPAGTAEGLRAHDVFQLSLSGLSFRVGCTSDESPGYYRLCLRDNESDLRPVLRAPRYAVIKPCRKNFAGADKGRKLPGERGEFLLLLDGPYEMWDRVLELH